MYETLIDALRASARTQNGIHFVERAGETEFISYGEVWERAQRTLASLQSLGVQAGDEVVLQFADLRQLVVAYWACLAGGAIPIPLAYGDHSAGIEKVFSVWKVLTRAWLACDGPELGKRMASFAQESQSGDTWMKIQERVILPDPEASPEKAALAQLQPDDIAFIQFSSGSTGSPKGVVLTHRNLLTNVQDILTTLDYQEGDSFLSWLPISHDFGMIGFHLAPTVAGCNQVRIPTEAFIWNPSLWFAMVHKYRVSILGSPNFGYRHFLKLFRRRSGNKDIEWDLSCVKVILNGAEPISADLCREFAETLAPYGLRSNTMTPGYGLAEASLIASLCPPGESVSSITLDRCHLGIGDALKEVPATDPNALAFVDCGIPYPQTEIRITDAKRHPLPENTVGYIEVRGNAVTSGYYRNPKATSEVLNKQGWLNTQDLGVMRNGRLYVVGRVKEMIIIGGVNYFPHDIEQALLREMGDTELNKYIACGAHNPELGSEELLIFVYYKRSEEEFAPIAEQIRRIVLQSLGLLVAHVIPVKKIPKTTSGKVQRFKLVQEFLAERGMPNLAAQPIPSADLSEVIDRIRHLAAGLLGNPTPDLDASFFDLGLTSLRLLTLWEQMEREFGISLDSTSALDFPTIRTLSEHVAQRLASQISGPKAHSHSKAEFTGDVAIIGMGCRFPGGVRSPRDFWQLLCSGKDPVREVPAERWARDPQQHEPLSTRQGGFLDRIDEFDPLFFGISPAEAEAMDPQQRLLLEVCHEALEHAGFAPSRMIGSRTGVFVGITASEYAQIGRDLGHGTGPYTFTGTMFNSAAGRISYTFGFQGPSIAIDTACSSSLVAIHQATRELQAGSCDLVLAGGVNLILKPDGHVSFSKLKALSPQGRCKTFDDSADGYIRGEGCGIVVLKRLEDAKRDGDTVLAVIRGTSVNHNGRSGGLTVPSGPAQQELVRGALERARIRPEDVDYVEAHGSATRLGDPQELNALAEVFAGRPRPLRIGSVKSNLGHLESAAGIAGLIKVVLCLQHESIAQNLHFQTPNALVDWNRVPFEVVTSPNPWKTNGKARIAGISSFGISGTNAHVVIEEAPAPTAPNSQDCKAGSFIFTLSAKSNAGLKATASAFAEDPGLADMPLSALCQTVNRSRSALPVRFACTVSNHEDLKRKLNRFATSDREARKATVSPEDLKGSTVFLFTGQGSHYPGMARSLYQDHPAFRKAFDRCDALFVPLIGESLRGVVTGQDGSKLHLPKVTQALIFTVEYALCRFWESLGIRPAMVLGHSIGEYAAACEAGVVNLEDAVRMVALRGTIMQETPGDGSMAGILANEDVVEGLISKHDDVFIAAINTDENFTISGSRDAIAQVVSEAKKARVFTETLVMAHAFHSPLMCPSAERLREGLRNITFHDPKLRMISTQTGNLIASAQDISCDYWSNHLCNPVLFREALKRALSLGAITFLEVGGNATLCGLGAQVDRNDRLAFLPSLRQEKDALEQVNHSLAELFLRGFNVEWKHYYSSTFPHVQDLPSTAFERVPVWFKPLSSTTIPAIQEIPATQEATALSNAIDIESIKAEIKDMISRVTGVSPADMEDDVHLFSLGVDSLMLVQIDKQVVERYGVDIPIKQFFLNLHTPEKIAAHIHSSIPESPRTLPAPLLPATTTTTSSPAPSGSLEAIVQAQLELMKEQLALLGRGASPASAPMAPKAASPKAERSMATKNALRDISLQEDDVNDTQREFIRNIVAEVIRRTPRSKDFAEQNRDGFADWIATLNFSLTTKEMAYPVVSLRSKGSRFWDVDGNEYIDTAIGYGVTFFGHNPDFIVQALQAQLERGLELGPQSELAGEVAKLIRDLTGVERVAFCNTGTEAVMVAIRLARAVSKRAKIVRFITSFHGSFDGVLAEAGEHGSVPMAAGILPSMVEDTVVLRYGSPESLEAIRAMGSDLAAVLVEPVQSRNPGLQPKEYLQELRRITRDAGIALVFDEMVTGFRIHPGGAQAHFGVQADLVTYGKIVGGGMPIGVVAGSAAYMDAIDGGTWRFGDASGPSQETTFFAGTFCKHPLAMAAAKAVLTRIKEEGAALLDRVSDLTHRFVERTNALFEAEEVPIRVKRFASMYRFESGVSQDLPRLGIEMNLFFRLLFLEGIYVWERRTCFFSAAHTEEDAERIFSAIQKAVAALRQGGFSFREAQTLRSASPATYPLSTDERRIYVLSHMKGGEAAYHITGALRLQGPLDTERVREILTTLARRHSILRTSFQVRHGELLHNVSRETDVVMEGDACQEELDQLVDRLVRPFDMTQAPLWRVGLFRRSDLEHILVMDFHHLVADGTSMSILIQEFLALYKGETLDKPSLPHSEFVRWEQGFLSSEDFTNQKAHWMKAMEPLPAPLNLPCDHPRPNQFDFIGGTIHFSLSEANTRDIKATARKYRVTPFMVLLAAYTLFLHKLCRQDDLCIGTPFDRRSSGAFDRTIGMFVQTLIIRLRPSSKITFADLLEHVKQVCSSAYAHPDYPLDLLKDDLGIGRDFSRNPLFDTMFIYENGNDRVFRTSNLTAETMPVRPGGATFDLTLELIEESGLIQGSLIYAKSLINTTTAQRWAKDIQRIIEEALRGPETPLGNFGSMADSERSRILKTFNATSVDYDRAETVHGLFHRTAQSRPDHPAVRFEERVLTYAELDAASDAFAARLIQEGAAPGSLVGLMLHRSEAMVMAMLGIMKAGAAYVPMDPDYPAARLMHMLEKSRATLLVTTPELIAQKSLPFQGKIVDPAKCEPVGTAPQVLVSPSDLAYVIFTSGSTGIPKGVMIEHGSVVNFLAGMNRAMKLPEKLVALGLTTVSFDISVLEIFLTLTQGGTLVLASESQQVDPRGLVRLMQIQGTTMVQVTPSRLHMILATHSPEDALRSVECLIVGGEAFPGQLLEDLQRVPGMRIYNAYGPTETTVWSTIKDMTQAKEPTLGTPIANTRTYVLGAQDELLPTGSVGDLYIAGEGLARGYWENEDLTASAFHPDPFEPGQRMYRTGDLATWNEEGELVYHGRKDTQVKLRGYRVEIPEVESVLGTHPSILQAAVAVRELGSGNHVLAAFCVPANGLDLPLESLRTHVAQHLPEYMVPSVIVPMDALPMTPNGKVDRLRLPVELPAPVPVSSSTTEPMDDLEQRILAIWKSLLGDRPIGIRDSFFDVGGTSFSVVLMHNALSELFPGALEVADIFANPTIAALKTHILNQRSKPEPLPEIPFPAPFFEPDPSQSQDVHLMAKVEGEALEALRKAARKHDSNPFEMITALYGLYLHKLLKRDTVDIPAAQSSAKGFRLCHLDFHRLRGLKDLVRAINEKTLGPLHADAGSRKRQAHGFLALLSEGAPPLRSDLRGFDAIHHVNVDSDALTITVEFDSRRLNPAQIELFLANFIKLIKAMTSEKSPADQLAVAKR